MQSLRNRAVAVGAGLLVMGGVVGMASAATDPVVTAIKGQERVLRSSSAAQNLKHVKINTPAQARRAVPKFRLLARKLDHAATVVSHASAATTTEKRGQTDWVKGVRSFAEGFRQFDGTLRDLEQRDKTAARSSASKAVKTIESGGKLVIRADKLLKIKASSPTA